MNNTQNEVLDRLKAVPIRDRARIDLAAMPEFLVIGPQRTGTTWLYMQLCQHPQIFMSTPKEPLYFCYLPKPLSSRRPTEGLPQTFEDYLALFDSDEARAARVRGEASAHYAVSLHWFPDVIDDIVALKPGIKCIGVVRDPIERAWSHGKLDLCKRSGRKVAEVPFEEWKVFFGNRYSRDSAKYEEVYDSWTSRLRSGHFLPLRFKDVIERPEELLQRTHEFLGVDTGPSFVPADAKTVRNQTTPDQPPADVAALLEELFGDDVRRLRASGWV